MYDDLATPISQYHDNAVSIIITKNFLDSKVHGDNMGPIWGPQDPSGPHVGPMDFAIWDCNIWSYGTYGDLNTIESSQLYVIQDEWVILRYFALSLGSSNWLPISPSLFFVKITSTHTVEDRKHKFLEI